MHASPIHHNVTDTDTEACTHLSREYSEPTILSDESDVHRFQRGGSLRQDQLIVVLLENKHREAVTQGKIQSFTVHRSRTRCARHSGLPVTVSSAGSLLRGVNAGSLHLLHHMTAEEAVFLQRHNVFLRVITRFSMYSLTHSFAED